MKPKEYELLVQGQIVKKISGESSSPNSLSSVHFVVPLWALRQVKPSLDVCSLQDLELIGIVEFGTSLIDLENMKVFFSGSNLFTSVAFKLLTFLFCLGFSKLVLFLPV